MSMQISRNQHPVEGWLANPENFAKVANALPTHLNAERMRRLYLTVFNNSPALKACSPASVIGCLLKSAQLGLEPDGGKLYLIPRGGDCTLQIGYQGYIELARRSGQIAAIEANIVYESDDFSIAYHLDSKFEHRPNLRRAADDKVLGVYCYAKLTSGERLFTWMSHADVEHVRRTSSGNSSTWTKHWGEMAKKTVLKRAAKMLPSSIEMATALETEADHEGYQVEAPVVSHTVVTTPTAVGGARLPAPPPPVEVTAEEVEVEDLSATEAASEPLNLDEVPFLSQPYPHARNVLTARIEQLHGTQRRLSDLLGISRQLLLQRQKVACETETVHPWWCNLLIMESSWLHEPPAGWSMPSPMLVMAAVELNQRTYDQYRRVRGPKKQVKP